MESISHSARTSGWISPSQPTRVSPIFTAAAAPRMEKRLLGGLDSPGGPEPIEQTLEDASDGEEVGLRGRLIPPGRGPHRPAQEDGHVLGLVRESVRPWQVDRADLEQPQRLRAAGAVARCDLEQGPEQRRAQLALARGHRVEQLDHRLVRQAQANRELGRGEAPPEHLVEPLCGERVGRLATDPLAVGEPAGGPMARGQRGGELLEPVDARHLLDHVGLARDVHTTERRRLYVEPVLGVCDLELECLQDPLAACTRDLEPEQAADAFLAEADDDRRRARAADVDRPGGQPGARQLEHQSRRERLCLERLFGLKLLLEAARGLAAQPQLERGAVDVGAVPGRGLEQHAGRRPGDLGALAAHHAGDRGGAIAVGDQHHLLVERAQLAVERAHGLARPGSADGQLVASDAVEVEGVQRLPGLEHRVVGDVDDVRDRALAGCHQAGLQPGRRGADADILEHARGEARAELREDLDGGLLDGAFAAGVRFPGRCGQRRTRGGVDLARHPVDAEAVGPVGRDLEQQHVGRERDHLLERRPWRRAAVEHQDALVVGADRELVLGQDHPLRFDASEVRGGERAPVGEQRTGPGDRDDLAALHVGGATHDLGPLAVAELDLAHLQALGVRVRTGFEHAADEISGAARRPVMLDPLDIGARQREPLGERLGAELGRAVDVKPLEGDAHQNCSRKRRSFS